MTSCGRTCSNPWRGSQADPIAPGRTDVGAPATAVSPSPLESDAVTGRMAEHVDALSRVPRLLTGLLASTSAEGLRPRRPAPRAGGPSRRSWIISSTQEMRDSRPLREGRRARWIPCSRLHQRAGPALGALPHAGRRPLRRFRDARRLSVEWLRALPDDAWHRSGRNPRLGTDFRPRTRIVCSCGGSTTSGHLRQVADVLRCVSCWPGMGPLRTGRRIDRAGGLHDRPPL